MPEGDDWLLRPVMMKLISYESLIDGTIPDLSHIARLNDLIDVQNENQRRLDQAIKDKNG